MRVCFWRPVVSHTPLSPPEPVHVAGIAKGIVHRYIRHKRRVRTAKIAAGWSLVCVTVGGATVAIGAHAGDWWQRLTMMNGPQNQAPPPMNDVHAVPEPSTILIFGLACAVLVLITGRTKQ